MTKCSVCGNIQFTQVVDYNNHMRSVHAPMYFKKLDERVLPIKTTNRSKMEIVKSMEEGKLKPWLIH